MEDNYDFSNAIRNPFAGREKGKFNVTIHMSGSEIKEPSSQGATINITTLTAPPKPDEADRVAESSAVRYTKKGSN
ncbi:MAG: hypothetical protein FWC20_03555 [Oscillospiraceae bacterium]|nr:hypothetical protein [Oscillospiraceae bacterium]MCL2278468.1 hypothetical protein [Oscillospiraceae bacterium]